ncbi:MAG: signal peptide peptidase SppA [Calditrichaeota bacterium]|nr:signal peptide peptidase SppA [Calditrichota bacterium]
MKPIHVILYTLLTLFLVFVIFVFVMFLIFKGLSHTKPSVAKNSTLVISLSGDIPEYVPASEFPVAMRKNISMKVIMDDIEKAKVDDRIKGILLRVNTTFMGWAKIDELRDNLNDFKSSGKYVIAYLGSFVGEKEYYLALAADSIFAVPQSFMEMNGLIIESIHLPGMLEKIGITVDYFAFGKYKSHSGESFGRKKHTQPVLQMLNDILDWEYAHLVRGIANRLGKSEQEIKATIDRGYFNAEKFQELGWINGLRYEDQIEDMLKNLNGIKIDKKLKKISAQRYAEIPLTSLGLNKGKKRIALIYSQGLIQEGGDTFSPLTMGMTAGTDPMIQSIRRAVRSRSVKAIVFRVDSPGGSGLGCDLVWREIQKAKEKKPVIVSMSDYAASGGYWVSMGASAIVAQPSTMTGSIGIWSIFPNVSGLYKKLGLNESNVKRGAHADMFMGFKHLTDYERKLYRDNLYQSYVDFVTKAAESRGMTFEQMEPIAQGRTWMGEKAKELGLVDELGGLDKAIEVAREKAGIDSTEKVKIVVYAIKKPWFEKIFPSAVLAFFRNSKDKLNLQSIYESLQKIRRPLLWPLLPYQIILH